MRRRAKIVAALTAALLSMSAACPGSQTRIPVAKGPSPAAAQVQASGGGGSGGGGGGGGNVRGAGQRLGQLLTGWVVPVMFGLAGVFILGSLARREVGGAVAVVVICILAGIFLLTPNVVESLIKGIANYVF